MVLTDAFALACDFWPASMLFIHATKHAVTGYGSELLDNSSDLIAISHSSASALLAHLQGTHALESSIQISLPNDRITLCCRRTIRSISNEILVNKVMCHPNQSFIVIHYPADTSSYRDSNNQKLTHLKV